MKAFMLLAFALLATASAKVFSRCELARIIKASRLDVFSGYSVANWVCLAEGESSLNSMITNQNGDKSTDYGIFQINSYWWCNDFKTPGAKNACGINCRDLLSDDIHLSIKCAKRIVKDPNGMSAWVAWNDKCQGDLSQYIAGCRI